MTPFAILLALFLVSATLFSVARNCRIKRLTRKIDRLEGRIDRLKRQSNRKGL
jgi:chaperonin cofactor prefoldin